MSESKHTPGPWQVCGTRHTGDLKIGRDARLHMVGPDGDAVAAVFFDMKTGRGFRDARLIAAAPDMLAALNLVKSIVDAAAENPTGFLVADFRTATYPDSRAAYRAIDAAIAKAEGR